MRLAYAANADINAAIDRPARVDERAAKSDSPIRSLPAADTLLMVVPAHAGAGASIVALALADAAAESQTDAGEVHLVESAGPARSGLAASTDTELGVDTTGGWQIGRRGGVIVHRRAVIAQRADPWLWPAMLHAREDRSPNRRVILDLSGFDDAGETGRSLAPEAPVTVLVTHCSVPGILAVDRLIEHWLAARSCADAPAPAELLEGRVIVAAVGPRRWPGAVTASLSPRLAEMRRAGRVVPVPVDARLRVTGASTAPLPSRVRAAARTVLTLLPQEPPMSAPVASAAHYDSDNRTGNRASDGFDALFDRPAEDRR